MKLEEWLPMKEQSFILLGPRKFHIVLTLSPDQAGDALCVKHINEEVYKLTQIPTESQKLIFKGKM